MEDRDYTEFHGKKILFLGAHVLTEHLIIQARKMGVYTMLQTMLRMLQQKK